VSFEAVALIYKSPLLCVRCGSEKLNLEPDLRAVAEELRQDFVFPLRKLPEVPASRHLHPPTGDHLFQIRRDFRSTKSFHQPRHWIHQVLGEMLNPAVPPTQVPLHAGPNDSPSGSGPVTHCGVSIDYAQHALLDEVEHLLI